VNFEDKKRRLKEIYETFEREAEEYKESAICKPGCAYCCIHFGSVDITTLEGIIIRDRVNSFVKPPFSCRQLYSLLKCDGRGPTVHRQAVELTEKTVQSLQRLDSTGYSGHISFIIHLLEKQEFRDFYLAGGLNPAQIMGFGKTHDIIINSQKGAASDPFTPREGNY